MKESVCLLFTGLLLMPLAYGSGAYIPGGGAKNESYNMGKALVTGAGDTGCKGCHASYKRNSLKNLGKSVSDYVVDCAAHAPCFAEKYNADQLDALSAYFKQRYKLR